MSEPVILLDNVDLTLGSGPSRVHVLRERGPRRRAGREHRPGRAVRLRKVDAADGRSPGWSASTAAASSSPARILPGSTRTGSRCFRGAEIGFVFQAFHLIETMTALENVAVPLELAGRADAFERGARRARPGGPRRAAVALSGAALRRRAAARRHRPRAGARPGDPHRRRADRQPRRRHGRETSPTSSSAPSPSAAPRWCSSPTTRSLRRAATAPCGSRRADRGARRAAAAQRRRDDRRRPAALLPPGASRAARRAVRLLRLRRLHRARRGGDRRRQFRLAGADRRHLARRDASSSAATSPSPRPSAKPAPEELDFLQAKGQLGRVATMRAMVRRGRRGRPGAGRAEGGRCRLSAWRNAGAGGRRATAQELLAAENGVFGALVAPELARPARHLAGRPHPARRRGAGAARRHPLPSPTGCRAAWASGRA